MFCISDLHLEFYKDPSVLFKNISDKLPKCDILILAGDIGVPLDKLNGLSDILLKFSTMYKTILYVPGNHEYYNSNMNRAKALDKLRDIVATSSKIVILDNDSITINDTLYIGSTLWSDINPRIKNSINDFDKLPIPFQCLFSY